MPNGARLLALHGDRAQVHRRARPGTVDPSEPFRGWGFMHKIDPAGGAKWPRTPAVRKPPALKAPGQLPPGPTVAMLAELQRSAGNHAVVDTLASAATSSPAALQRQPTKVATAPASVAAPAAPRTGPVVVTHEGVPVSTDSAQVRKALEDQVTTRGWTKGRDWAFRLINIDISQDLNIQLNQNVTGDELQRVRTTLKAQVSALETDAGSLVTTFENDSKTTAREILTASEKEINEQLKTLGIKENTFLGIGTGGYSMDKAAAAGMRTAIQDLISSRMVADKAAKVYFAARDEANAAFNKTAAPSLAAAIPEITLTPELAKRLETSEAEGLRTARAYDAMAAEKQKTYPILATVTPGPDALNQLIDLAGRKPDSLAGQLAYIAQDRLKNIATVREELGGRFSVWKEPRLRDITKRQTGVKDWQARVIDEKVAAVAAAERDTQMLIAAVAIGLGLVAAIPTGGASVAAAAAVTAAAAGSMVLSIYGAYEHYQDYSLTAAAQSTSFDKAKAISQGEPPDIFWLAVDIVTAIADVQQAATAFKALKGVLAEAKAAKTAEKTEELLETARKYGVPEETQTKLVAAAKGGVDGADTTAKVAANLDDIRRVFARGEKFAEDVELAKAYTRAADEAFKEEKVLMYAGTAEERQAAVLELVRKHAKKGANVEAEAKRLSAEIEKAGTNGIYDPATDTIIVKAERSRVAVASTLAHELAHRKQEKNLLGGLQALSTQQMEYQAFYAQQQFLRNLNLPAHRIPKNYQWLMTADQAAIRAYVRENYKMTQLGVAGMFANYDDVGKWILTAIRGGK